MFQYWSFGNIWTDYILKLYFNGIQTLIVLKIYDSEKIKAVLKSPANGFQMPLKSVDKQKCHIKHEIGGKYYKYHDN